MQLIINRKLYAYSLSIGTKIDDLGWPWTAIRWISQICQATTLLLNHWV